MYHDKKFKSVESSDNGEVNQATIFHYRQTGNTVWATYQGGSIVQGTLIAKVDEEQKLEMRYQHLSVDGNFKTGICHSIPERLPDGRIRLHETWQWTSGDQSKGESILEEIK